MENYIITAAGMMTLLASIFAFAGTVLALLRTQKRGDDKVMEMVNHPQHYKRAGRKECIDEMTEVFGIEKVITFCELNSYKYYYRRGLKEGNSEDQDKKKAEWYKHKAEELRGDK